MNAKKKKIIAFAIASATVVVLAMLYFFNPVETSFAPKCIIHRLTGWNCAGCGMQRFLHAFMHGRFLEAFSYNYMLIILIPYLALFYLERLVLRGNMQKKIRKVIESKFAIYTLAILAPCWMIVRNILHI